MHKRKDGRWEDTVNINGFTVHVYGKTQAEVLAKIEKRKQRAAQQHLVPNVADEWYAWKEPQVRWKTAQSYQAPIKDIKEHFAGVDIRDITPKTIKAFLRELADDGYAKTTVQHRLNALSMICQYAVAELEIININPCREVTLPRNLPSTERELPTDKDLRIINENADKDRFSFMLYFIANTGLRLGEALAITDKSFVDNMIVISTQAQWQPNQAVIIPPKTKNSTRVVPLLDVLKVRLPKFKGYLFSVDGSKPYSQIEYKRRMEKYRAETGLSCTAHQLRHLYATVLYNAKIDTKVAASIMGHDEMVMRQIYTHLDKKNIEEAAQTLNEYVNR